jgi:hypothetical protein
MAEHVRVRELSDEEGNQLLRIGLRAIAKRADRREIVNTCGWDRGDLPSILLSDHLPRVVF